MIAYKGSVRTSKVSRALCKCELYNIMHIILKLQCLIIKKLMCHLLRLKEWLGKQRSGDILTPERIALLNDIDFIFTYRCRTFFPNQAGFHANFTNADNFMFKSYEFLEAKSKGSTFIHLETKSFHLKSRI